MFVEYLGAQRYCFLCGNDSVGQNFQSQLVIVGDVTHTGIFNLVANVVYRRINRVGIDQTNYRGVVLLILILRHISSAVIECKLHVESCILGKSSNVQFRVQNFNFRILLDITSGDHARTGHIDQDSLCALRIELRNNALHVQDDFGNVLFYTGDRGDLVQHAVNLNADYCNTGKRAEQDSAQGVSKGSAVAAFERFDNKFANFPVITEKIGDDVRLFNHLYHNIPPINLRFGEPEEAGKLLPLHFHAERIT